MSARQVRVGDLAVGGGAPLVLISGPCVVEPERVMRQAAAELREICGEAGVPLIFKSSFLKDNRTSPASYRGPGLEEGLRQLAALRSEFGFPVTADVHGAEQVRPAAACLDLLQIPAFLCRQTSLLEQAGQSGRPVNLKKGQFMSAGAMAGALQKAAAPGGGGVMVTERGNSFGYDQLVCDLLNVPRLQALGCPVLLDAGHAAPEPAMIAPLARCGVAAGADGLFIESHPLPATALCDGERSLSTGELARLLRELQAQARQLRQRAAAAP